MIDISDLTRLIKTRSERDAAAMISNAENEAALLRRGAERDQAAAIRLAQEAERQTVSDQVGKRIREVQRETRAHLLEVAKESAQAITEHCHKEVRDLKNGDDYVTFISALEAHAHAVLGDDAEIVRDPEAGGIVATTGRRRLDWTLDRLSSAALDNLRLSGEWVPVAVDVAEPSP